MKTKTGKEIKPIMVKLTAEEKEKAKIYADKHMRGNMSAWVRERVLSDKGFKK